MQTNSHQPNFPTKCCANCLSARSKANWGAGGYLSRLLIVTDRNGLTRFEYVGDEREWCATSPIRRTVIRTLRRLHLNWTATAVDPHQWKTQAAQPIALCAQHLPTGTHRIGCACVRGIAAITHRAVYAWVWTYSAYARAYSCRVPASSMCTERLERAIETWMNWLNARARAQRKPGIWTGRYGHEMEMKNGNVGILNGNGADKSQTAFIVHARSEFRLWTRIARSSSAHCGHISACILIRLSCTYSVCLWHMHAFGLKAVADSVTPQNTR